MAEKIKSFSEVVGHKNLINFLQRHIKEDNIADVVIFHGSSGIGKSSIAKLLAIEVATRFETEELKQQYIKNVITDNMSTDSIKLFNMSEIQEKDEKIQEVKSELSLGFSKTRRKIIILDEAHNMSKAAQDAILTELESLEKGIYVFICTTEIGALRTALQSRCKASFRLYDLTEVEAKTVVRKAIDSRGLTFDVNVNMIVSLICSWGNNQPRKMCNLLDNFEKGSLVTSKDLEIFINVNTAPTVIELLKYLYGSMTLGIEYINSIQCDEAFVMMVIEVCKVALGHVSSSISPKDIMYIKDFMNGRNEKHIMKFTATVSGLSEIRRHKVVSAFMQAHVGFEAGTKPEKSNEGSGKMEDINTLINNIEGANVHNINTNVSRVPSLEEMFGDAEVVEEQVITDTAYKFGNENLCSSCGSSMLSTGRCSNHECESR